MRLKSLTNCECKHLLIKHLTIKKQIAKLIYRKFALQSYIKM